MIFFCSGEAEGTVVLGARGFDGAGHGFGTVTVMRAVADGTSELLSYKAVST